MNSSFDLWVALKNAGYIKKERDPLWWPRSGTFWVVVGAILTQQTKWEKVEQSIDNLEKAHIQTLEDIIAMPIESLAMFIQPSGFYNTKATNLHLLCQAIIRDFGSFESFCEESDRSWLLAQKGIGEESADAILCYACLKEHFVVDAYTARLLTAFGYEFDSYSALQEWMVDGIVEHFSEIQALDQKQYTLHEVYARFHGKIVEYCKENSRGKIIMIERLGLS